MPEKTTNRNNLSIYKTRERHWGENQSHNLKDIEEYLLDKYIKNSDERILEAGCGGGRITLKLKEFGVNESNIDAFDYNEDFVKNAKRYSDAINFFVADAAELGMLSENTYDLLIYLMQVLCFLPRERVDLALSELHRIGKTGATVLFSFLNYNGRWFNRILSTILAVVRTIHGEKKSAQELPWLKFEDGLNWSFLAKNQAVIYWFREEEIQSLLVEHGFKIKEVIFSEEKKKKSSVVFYVCEIV